MWARSFTRTSALALALLAGAGCGSQASSDPEIVLAAAASLRGVMPELIRTYLEEQEGCKIVVTYGGSSALREQVEAGAPIDGVVFAGAAPVDQLIQSGHADAKSRRVVATNALVLIGPADTSPLSFETIENLPAGEKIAIGDPRSAPVGMYARAVFDKLGKWQTLRDRVVYGGNVAAVLAYARRGEVAAAVVYATDVVGLSDVVVLDEAKRDWAPQPEVVAAVTSGGQAGMHVSSYLGFLVSARGGELLGRYGFGLP
jgi:molybdate transport system substrate-binding protein